uniref:HlyD family type I secretion periplasmic adaptor subunit n=1 Tax=uncultured Caulobacter sp. TaxID=158749 RepID=UPI0025F1041B|nr:HlyD family type I secretion periplasmic adaptor subunit [uncultured Caulobacter sp.]
MKPPKLQRPTDNYKGVARIGYIVIGITFVGLLGWAALAPLDSAVIANGVVSAEGNKKTVQHLEGGMLRKILVREGEKVKAGQVLFEMDPTQVDAAAGITKNQYVALKAMEARLLAERDQRPAISFPADLLSQRNDPAVARTLADEQSQFLERRQTISGQVDLMNAQRDQFQSEIDGIERQTQGLKDQLGYIEDELNDLRKIYDKGLVPRPRLLALEREQASLSGSIGRLTADRSKAVQGMSETQLKIRQIKQQFFQEVSQNIAETRVKLAEVTEKEVVASDAQRRIKVVSPVSGTAQNLRFFTEGAVIRPAEPMVDIAPDDEAFVIQAHFQPTDVDNVRAGMVTEVRLPAFHSREIPILNGKIESISRDRLSDPEGKTVYFLGIVRVDPKQLPKPLRSKITAGMPAQVIVPTGERTVLQYLFSPLRDTLRTTMREE